MKPQNNETSISKANDEVQPLHAGKGLLRLAEKAVLKVHQKMGLEKKFSEVQFIYKVKKVFYIVFYWTLFSIAQDCYDLLVLGNYAVLKVDIYIGLFILTNTFTTLLGGIIGGFIIIFYLERLWRTRSVGYTLIMMSLFYTLIIFVAVGIGSLIYQSYAQGLAFYHPEVISETMINFANPNFFKNYLTWWLVAFATIVLLQVNDKYGPGVLLDLVFGNYHKPKSEERIFMFLDLRASTKTAEHMSEEAYFNYIRDFFMDTTDPILETKGEIYQYVGDEIVVSWKMKNGLEQANALRCFFSYNRRSKETKHVIKINTIMCPDSKPDSILVK